MVGLSLPWALKFAEPSLLIPRQKYLRRGIATRIAQDVAVRFLRGCIFCSGYFQNVRRSLIECGALSGEAIVNTADAAELA